MIPSADTLRRAGEIVQEIGQLRSELARLFSDAGGAVQVRSARTPAKSSAGGRKPRNMSPEARARIASAARARWAKYRADKKVSAAKP